MGFQLKRAYDPPADGDGYRVLVDRLWPRGVRKEDAEIDLWAREITPTPELRRWFGHRPERFEEFRAAYIRELEEHEAAGGEAAQTMDRLRERAAEEPVTLVYAARDPVHNHAIILARYLEAAGEIPTE